MNKFQLFFSSILGKNPMPILMLGLQNAGKTTLHFQDTQAVIFVVDSTDRERIGEARQELNRLLNHDELKTAILLICANKQDLPNAMNAAEVTDKLGLHNIRNRG